MLKIGGFSLPLYIAVIALTANLVLCVALTFLFNLFQMRRGEDVTTPADFEAHPVIGAQPEVLEAQIERQVAERQMAQGAERMAAGFSRTQGRP